MAPTCSKAALLPALQATFKREREAMWDIWKELGYCPPNEAFWISVIEDHCPHGREHLPTPDEMEESFTPTLSLNDPNLYLWSPSQQNGAIAYETIAYPHEDWPDAGDSHEWHVRWGKAYEQDYGSLKPCGKEAKDQLRDDSGRCQK